MATKYYYSTRDLLVIAVLAALGGVMSAYVGYLANLVNHLVGVPYGPGQILGGLHILWLVLIMAITQKKGSGVLGGAVKGFVELVSGSPKGIFVILLSCLEGVFAEIGFWPFQKYPRLAYIVSGGFGSFASVFIAQALFMLSPDLYQGFASVYIFVAVGLLACISGIVFAGYFTGGIMDSLADAGLVKLTIKKKSSTLAFSLPKAFALVCGLAIVFTAVYYFAFVQAHGDPLTVQVTGDVAYSGNEYYIPAYRSQYVTLNAKLDGSYTHLPAANYTGLPITVILKDVRVKDTATSFDVVAADGYYQTFALANVTAHDDLILVEEHNPPDGIWLVAKNYAGGMWVHQVTMIRVY